jgi:uncharacterized SAM-binding protein YcdF (DUF218 family)
MDLMPRIIELLITPPGIVVLLLGITFLVYIKSYWAGAMMLAFSVIVLIATSLPLTAHVLMTGLQGNIKPLDLVLDENSPKKNPLYLPRGEEKSPPQAIVVLGAGRYHTAPEYDNEDTATPLGLERLRYAAWLQRKTGLPILVSGGRPNKERAAEAEFMKKVLTEDFRANVRWAEDQSRNTLENAGYSATILAESKVRHVYLVTQAAHMRRAIIHFESAGVRVTAAPTGFHTLPGGETGLLSYLPSANGMWKVSLALHERLGLLWREWNAAAEPPVPAPKPAK